MPLVVIRLLVATGMIVGAVSGCDKSTKKIAIPAVTSNSHIPRSDLVQMFAGIREQTKWNIDGDMLWGYFFVDTSRERLAEAAQELQSQGYRFVDLHETEQDGKADGKFVLHVEKVERHTIDSLDARNAELDAFATRHGLQSYDGMDVGPVTPATKPSGVEG